VPLYSCPKFTEQSFNAVNLEKTSGTAGHRFYSMEPKKKFTYHGKSFLVPKFLTGTKKDFTEKKGL